MVPSLEFRLTENKIICQLTEKLIGIRVMFSDLDWLAIIICDATLVVWP
jgi:hypothetical protein